jgi:hypothetical protein
MMKGRDAGIVVLTLIAWLVLAVVGALMLYGNLLG